MLGNGPTILEAEGVKPTCERRLGVHGRHALPWGNFEFVDHGNANSSILEVVLSSFKRITDV